MTATEATGAQVAAAMVALISEGRGMVSGVPTPSCADTIPEGWEMAHAMWCNDYADDVCNKCASQMLKEAS